MANKLLQYVKESKDELKKVIWPSKKETVRHTLLVIGVSVGVAIFLGIADFIFNIAFERLVL
ncbi:preprotein translocase subunit SecE [Patescibacteria group bacterium]